VTNWHSYEYLNADKGKAPTELCYTKQRNDEVATNDHGQDDNSTWGYGIPSSEETIKWFKLLLLDEVDMSQETRNSPQIQSARALLQRSGKSPQQAVADYLRNLWNHVLTSIEKDMGEIAVESTVFRVVLTVPAVWTTKAVKRMRQAAIDAGILDARLAGETKLHFVSEPEAAALATFDDLKALPNFKVARFFILKEI
jgi:molecular chaperone DnaK (HSP70)